MRLLTWSAPLRLVLAAMWTVYGLEQFGVRWPAWLAGEVRRAPELLRMLADQTPFAWFRTLLEGVLLPAADGFWVPMGLLQLAMAAALVSGRFLKWAALLGVVFQVFLWLGRLAEVWPLYHPLLVAAHLALAIPRWRGGDENPGVWLALLRLSVGLSWAYLGAGGPWFFLFGLLIMIGLGARWLSLAGLLLIWVPWRAGAWGPGPWSYYLAVAAHIALVAAAHRARPAVVELLPESWRRVTG